VKFGGNFFAKKFPPNPLQEIHINFWLADFPGRKSASQSIYRSFWRGVWGVTFFRKVLPRLLP
jgi:hypothetical protein